jgi:hypothetical protein
MSIQDNELLECSLISAEQALSEITDMRLTKFTVNIINNNRYLSYDSNCVYYSPNKKNCNWVLEEIDGDSLYYIRASVPLCYGEKYLGCPNRNNRLYLYTTNNRFTRWKIVKNEANDGFFSVQYAGDKFDMNAVTLVVARYNEDVRWVAPYNDIACIYNKGCDDLQGIIDRVIPLDNVGREGNTYLHHIMEHYDKLTDKTIFMQGNPFTHNNTVLYGIDNYERMDSLQPMGLGYNECIPPPEIIDRCSTRTSYGLHFFVLKITENCEYHPDNAFKDKGIDSLIERYKNSYRLTDRAKYCLPDISVTENFLDRSKVKKTRLPVYPFTFCALFSVNRDIILRNDIETYFNISTELTDKNPDGGLNGYILERLWLYIFDYVH